MANMHFVYELQMFQIWQQWKAKEENISSLLLHVEESIHNLGVCHLFITHSLRKKNYCCYINNERERERQTDYEIHDI